jgi:hypothetical protein
MSKLRSVSTGFWSDPLIEELTPNEKLLFLYLITNEKTNMLGIYESSIKKISFETGIVQNDIETILKRLEGLNRIKRLGNWILLVNYMKHQNYNPNMKKSAIAIFDNLPNDLGFNTLRKRNETVDEGFERVSKALVTVRKIEVEYEVEYENERESLNIENDSISDGDNNPVFFDEQISLSETQKLNTELKEQKFEEFWTLYNKKVERKNCKKKFDKLSMATIDKILQVVPTYVNSTPDVKYRKNPETWLNGECWEDEIIVGTNNSQLAEQDYNDKMGIRISANGTKITLNHGCPWINHFKFPLRPRPTVRPEDSMIFFERELMSHKIKLTKEEIEEIYKLPSI